MGLYRYQSGKIPDTDPFYVTIKKIDSKSGYKRGERIAAMKNDGTSYDEMYRENRDMVYDYAFRMLNYNAAEAEDLTQEVFWVAFLKWDILKDHPNIPGFLMKSAKNKIMQWQRDQRMVYIENAEVFDVLSGGRGEKTFYSMVDLCSTMEKIVSRENMNMLLYYYGYGCTAPELAKRFGITECCFRVRVARLRDKVRACLEQ